MNEAEEQTENSALQYPTESAQMVMWSVCSLQGCKVHHLNAEKQAFQKTGPLDTREMEK